jgi:hypothetical protein
MDVSKYEPDTDALAPFAGFFTLQPEVYVYPTGKIKMRERSLSHFCWQILFQEADKRFVIIDFAQFYTVVILEISEYNMNTCRYHLPQRKSSFDKNDLIEYEILHLIVCREVLLCSINDAILQVYIMTGERICYDKDKAVSYAPAG